MPTRCAWRSATNAEGLDTWRGTALRVGVGRPKARVSRRDTRAEAKGFKLDGKEDIRAKERRTERARVPMARAIKAW